MLSEFIFICLCGQYFLIYEVTFPLRFICGKHIRASENTTFLIEVPHDALYINVHFKLTIVFFEFVIHVSVHHDIVR